MVRKRKSSGRMASKGFPNPIDVHVGKLRRKIDIPGLPPLFKTERGVGYMVDAP